MCLLVLASLVDFLDLDGELESFQDVYRPDLASYLQIEERALEAGGLTSLRPC
jgi:hypothetical protein